MRTAMSPKTGLLWQLCEWNDVCQMPVGLVRDSEVKRYCRWHRRCLDYPAHAGDHGAFVMWLDWLNKRYPAMGWWRYDEALLWSVMQGVQSIWDVERELA